MAQVQLGGGVLQMSGGLFTRKFIDPGDAVYCGCAWATDLGFVASLWVSGGLGWLCAWGVGLTSCSC